MFLTNYTESTLEETKWNFVWKYTCAKVWVVYGNARVKMFMDSN